MKEIGQKLQDAREEIGISLEEAAEDLKLRPNQLQNIESGNMEAFKDIFYLKYFIRDYAKYLGLNFEDIVDEFNEYLFDYTSKISVEDIKKAKEKMANVKVDKKITSPYTKEPEKKFKVPRYVIIILIILFLLSIGFLIYNAISNKKPVDNVVINWKGGMYELT